MADIIRNIVTRIDSTANWTTLNPVPANGEQCIEILPKGLFKLKVGDGKTPWIALKYATMNGHDPRIGDLSELITRDKTNIVYAINSVQEEVNLTEDDIARIKEVLKHVVPQYSELPAASESTFGVVAQYIGPTTEDYTHGLFYEVVEVVPRPEHVDFEATVEDPEQVEFNQETFLENIHPEQHQIWMLTYNIFDEQGAWYYNGQVVDPADYGITLTGEFEQGNTLRIEYFPAKEDTYGWEKVDTTDISSKVDKTEEASKIYGTDEHGNQTIYDKEDFGKVDDVRLNGVSVVGIKEEKVADIDLVAADSEYHNDAVLSITNVQQALDNLMNIHYYVNPSYTTFTVDRSGSYDVGTVLSQPFTVTWVLNKQPESGDVETLKYEGTTLLNIMSLEDHSKWKSGTYTYTNDITSNSPATYTFRVDYTDNHSTVPSGKTGSCSATRTFNFMYRRYWGVTSTETLSDEQLYALSNELSTSRSQERDFNCTGGKYWWFVIPTTYCSGIQFTDVGSGLPMTLPPECISSRTITNSQGISYSVNVYRGEFKQTASSVKIRVS